MSFFNYNGNICNEGAAVISPDSMAFKYGDGLFETIKMVHGKLFLKEYHFERLFYGMQVLAFETPSFFTGDFLEKEIIELAKKNQQSNVTRVRLVVFKGNGDLADSANNLPEFIIQTWDLPGNTSFNTNGFAIDIYEDVKKSCDILANIKTNNFLPYRLAAVHAKKNNLNDCIVLNSHNNICDTSVANLFIIKDENIYTPPLTEGCIAGVMRRWVLERIKFNGNAIIEKPLNIEDLKQANEVFLTNSLHPLRWVKQFHDVEYKNIQSLNIYNHLIKTF